jgi:hypothetical protein
LNAGVNGWTTDNQLLFWRHEGARMRPALVLLAFDTTNDVFENQHRLVGNYPWWPDKPYARLRDGVLSIENLPLAPLRRTRRIATDVGNLLTLRSAAFRILVWSDVVSRRLLYLPGPIPPADGVAGTPLDVYRRDYPEVWTEAWRITRGLLLRLRDDVERHGARLAVVVVNAREEVAQARWELMPVLAPQLTHVPLDRDKPDRLVRRFLARRGIATIPLLEVFRERFPAGPPGFYGWNMHWAPAGHAAAAEVIADAIEHQGLLP